MTTTILTAPVDITANASQRFVYYWDQWLGTETTPNDGRGLMRLNFNGSLKPDTTTGAIGGTIGRNVTNYNADPYAATGEKTTYKSVANRPFCAPNTSPDTDGGETSVFVYSPAAEGADATRFPAQLSRWTCAITPNDTTRHWNNVMEELNIVNRGLDTGWRAYRNSLAGVTVDQFCIIHNYSPEVHDHSGETTVKGKNLLAAECFAMFGVPGDAGYNIGFYNCSMYEPNAAVGGTGRYILINGDISGNAVRVPYAPIEFRERFLHGLVTTSATFDDGAAVSMAGGQKLTWTAGGAPTHVASISASTSAGTIYLTPGDNGSGDRRVLIGAPADGRYVQISGNGEGGNPTIKGVTASGTGDANLNFYTQGHGDVFVGNDHGAILRVIDQTGSGSLVNTIDVRGGYAGGAVSVSAAGSDTDVNLVISPQNNGFVLVNRAHIPFLVSFPTAAGSGLSVNGSGQLAFSLQVSPPATHSSPGKPGQWAYDGTYRYDCVATNVWDRRAVNVSW